MFNCFFSVGQSGVLWQPEFLISIQILNDIPHLGQDEFIEPRGLAKIVKVLQGLELLCFHLLKRKARDMKVDTKCELPTKKKTEEIYLLDARSCSVEGTIEIPGGGSLLEKSSVLDGKRGIIKYEAPQ